MKVLDAELAGERQSPSRRRSLISVLRKASGQKLAVLGAFILILVVACAVLAPLLAPTDPLRQNLSLRLQPPLKNGGGWAAGIMGTDQLGRDILSRVIYGSRVSLVVSSVSVCLASILGVSLGLVAGYYRGLLDSLIMRLVDVQLSFPFILLTLAIVALLGPSLENIIVVFAITSWPAYARTVRASVLSVREIEYVEAGRAVGVSDLRLLFRHILPNVVSPLIVIASFGMAQMVIMEASLGFLGLGVQPPTPTWGNMLADGRDYLRGAWWMAVFPGLAIMFTVAGINFIGDGLRDILDPTSTVHQL